jgi:Asp-tRNA(Asn)/Glu-tRNA(Gln) amidotransferase A subunit family amidase
MKAELFPDAPSVDWTNTDSSGDHLVAIIDLVEARCATVEPQVLSLVPEEGRFERLRQEAQALLKRYPDSPTRPPLFGVLVAVKDVFHVDGLPTAAGSRLPVEELSGPQATCVTSLVRAGALVLGKTACTEFAYFGAGPTQNPHLLGHTPGGSSSGSAAAVAAGLCPLALGTQTIGSISRPAAFCGVVGYKPTYNRISRHGLLPLAPSLDHPGPLAPNVTWARRVAAVLCKDWKSEPNAATRRKPVLGIPEGPYLEKAEPAGREHFRTVCQHLKNAGYVVRTVAALADIDAIEARHRRIVAAEAAVVHQHWFTRFGHLYHEKTRQLVEDGQQISPAQLEKDLRGRTALRHQLVHLMDSAGIDLWISPAAPGPAPSGLVFTGDPIMNLPWSHCGLPTLALPAGCLENGLPMGLQLAAAWYADEVLLAWGEALQTVLDS